MSEPFKYPGDELALFQYAKHWKKYFSKQVNPYIKGDVLEVGAGIGSTTVLLNNGSAKQWLLLEPDGQMFASLQNKLDQKKLPDNCAVQKGTIDQFSISFDTIIYIDVLEHIEADSEELQKAASLLNQGGHLIVLAPALQHLFSPFDKAIGHYRRYNKKMMKKLTPDSLKLIQCKYYDSTGYFASLINKLFLKQKSPTLKQVTFLDSYIMPVSTITDPLLFHIFGKSILAVWTK